MSGNIVHVIKRDRSIVVFDAKKITEAIIKSMGDSPDELVAEKITRKVLRKLKSWENDTPHVDQIHILVENSLMDAKLHDAARSYITYRDANKPDIFRKRVEVEPSEYPQFAPYKEAVHKSFWTFKHLNYESDIQDMKVTMTPEQVAVATKAMLAISQIEVAVKVFWGTIHTKMPKPEVAAVGFTFADSEVRHEDAYKELIKLLGFHGQFKSLADVPCMAKRIKYLDKVNANMRATDNRDFFEAIILFSIFVENVSLFSQFLILMSYRKHLGKLKGISNAVEATSKEEIIHAEFGFELIKTIKKENPTWFDEDLIEYIKDISQEAVEAEMEVVDWIFETGDLDFMPKATVKEYIKYRTNNSLVRIGVDPIFECDENVTDEVEWFEDELIASKLIDFFHTDDTKYAQGNKSFTAKDLF